MCGIAGFIDFKNTSSNKILEEMTNSMVHRGPDGEGVKLMQAENCLIGFGHRRLAIIDLTETGKQPMSFKHLSITFNGEIYNYTEIKEELISLNHDFTGNSDTEVILQAFNQWGVDCVSKFIGMFAFVIYDSIKNTVYCFRDRAGVKPFFYYYNEGLFLFASELKAFHKHPSFVKQIDMNALSAFIQFGNVPTPHCIFKHCNKLQPGHFLCFDLTNKKIQTKKYWNVYDSYNKPKMDISFEEAKSKLTDILDSAFNYRMVSDVPVGIFLSGGYDSTCVTAILQKSSSSKLKTFTIAVPDMGLNEAPYAKEVSNFLGTEHYELECNTKEAIDLIKDIPFYYDEPFGDQSAIPTMLVSKMAREHVTVSLSADGGDEIFAGYNRYDYMMRYSNKLNSMPKATRLMLKSVMNKVPSRYIPYFNKKYNFHNRYEKLKGLLADPSPKNIMLNLSQQFDQMHMDKLIKQKVEPLKTNYLSDELDLEHYSDLSYIMAIDYQTYMLDDILQKVDRATMAFSLEGREPFLDHRIIEFAAQLPNEYKYHKGVKKHILKEVVHSFVPKELMDRPKRGFAIPIEDWLLNELKPITLKYLAVDRISKQDIFEVTEIESLKKQFYSGRKELALKIWYLLMFQMWYEKWM